MSRSDAMFFLASKRFVILILTSWRDFLQGFEKSRPESGRGRFSRQFLSLVQTCRRTINQSGGTERLLYENENFTHNKFDKPVVPPLREDRGASHSARARSHMADACAEGPGTMPANVQRRNPQHRLGNWRARQCNQRLGQYCRWFRCTLFRHHRWLQHRGWISSP